MQVSEERVPVRSGVPNKLFIAGVVAVALPTLLTVQPTPSTTFINQATALAGWGLLLAAMSAPSPSTVRPPKTISMLSASLLLLMLCALAGMMHGGLPTTLGWPAVAMLGAATLCVWVGARQAAQASPHGGFSVLAAVLVVAGFCSLALAAAQYCAPSGWGAPWIAPVSSSGRVGANLRQPNHLSSLLLAAMAAWVYLHESAGARWFRKPRVTRVAVTLGMVGLVIGVVLTASRTGAVCVLLLAAWGILDRQLSRFSRVVLAMLPLVYAVSWVAFGEWAQMHDRSFAGAAQLHAADISSSRFAIWSNALELIRQNPWSGVGWGEFNFAWTLTPFPDRPGAFFDHSHNLFLQLWVELGVPLGTLVLALMLWALWKAIENAAKAVGPSAPLLRAALMMVLMMGVHSLLEYPLWYAYFLLPTAFAWGVCLATAVPSEPASTEHPSSIRGTLSSKVVIACALLMTAGACYSIYDYQRVVGIFVPPANAAPLDQRIATGQRSLFFAHHAHYAAVTTAPRPSEVMESFKSASHYLLDARLMMAWAKALNESGEVDKARYIAARLKEFRNPQAADFFAVCDEPVAAGESLPFQCTPPTRAFSFRDFR